MMGNIIKLLSAIVIGYILGFVAGRILGGFFGAIASIFFSEIISSNQTILLSIVLAILPAGILGYIATEIGRTIFETLDHPILGVAFGIAISIIVLLVHGTILIPDAGISYRWFHDIPIPHPIAYGAAIGHYTGIIIFWLMGIRIIIYEEMETRKRIKFNEESKNELSFYKSRKTEENK
jgi:hypothetical protein